jgi:HlyD family secretion protein
MGKIFRYGALLFVLAIFVLTLVYLIRKSQKPEVEFRTAHAVVTDIYRKTVATGSVLPRREVFMKSQVSGILDELVVQPGQQVKKGDVLARVRIIPNLVNLNEAETRLNQALINFEQAEIDFKRNKLLLEQEAISKADFQAFEQRLRSTREEKIAAENNLQIVREGVAKSSGSATNTLIRSTITGMVLDVPVKVGNSVIEANTFSEGTTIASVADMGEMIFEGKVDESEVGKLKQGMELLITVGAIEKEIFKASLEYIAPKGMTENGAIQFLIRAAVNKDNLTFLRAGYSANADIILDKRLKVLSVAENLIQFEGNKVFVELKKGNFFEKKYITTGLSDGLNIEVKSGLSEKDQIKVPGSGGNAEAG